MVVWIDAMFKHEWKTVFHHPNQIWGVLSKWWKMQHLPNPDRCFLLKHRRLFHKFITEGLRGFVLNAGVYIPTPAGRRSRARWGSGWHRAEESPHTHPPAAAGLQECLPFHYCSETNRHFRIMHQAEFIN